MIERKREREGGRVGEIQRQRQRERQRRYNFQNGRKEGIKSTFGEKQDNTER